MRSSVWSLAVVSLMVVAGCKAGAGLGANMQGAGSAGGELSGAGAGKCTGDFGANASAQKLEAFLTASKDFEGAAADMEVSLRTSCQKLGESLGMTSEELSGDLKTSCNNVAAKLKAELTSLKAEAKLKASVVIEPPRCEVNVDAYAKCAGECNVDVKPGEMKLECEGGEMYGRCDAVCEGSCSVDAHGECKGACEGTCGGSCTGKCQGTCDGKCSSKGPNGECNGKCEGTCNGTCSAGCTGECSGTCTVHAEGSCSGECHGGCSVEYKEPRCTGELKAPEVDADCRASCDAKVSANAKCTPPKARLKITGKVKGDAEAKVAKLQAAVESSIGEIAALQAKLKLVASSGEALVKMSGEVPSAVGDLGLRAAACAGEAVAKLPKAAAQVSASVEVSVNLSASASAK